MGGKLVVKDGSCKRCNGEFAVFEGKLKDATAPLLHLLKIRNREGIVRNASVKAEVRGLDMKNLQGFVDVEGQVQLLDRVVDATNEDGRKVKRGFFMTKEAGDKFAAIAQLRFWSFFAVRLARASAETFPGRYLLRCALAWKTISSHL